MSQHACFYPRLDLAHYISKSRLFISKTSISDSFLSARLSQSYFNSSLLDFDQSQSHCRKHSLRAVGLLHFFEDIFRMASDRLFPHA